MLLDELHKKKQEIENLASLHGARGIQVFGSVVRREESQNSDVDFLVDFPVGYDLFTQRLPLAEKLADLIGKKVDLIPKHELDTHTRDRVIQEARYL